MTYALKRMDGVRVLITGGLGFIGSNIAQKLVPLGAKVTILDACLDPYGWSFANISEIKDAVEFIKGDTRDLELMRHVVKDKDVIIDCASQISHTISIKQPFLDIDINCKGALTLLEAVREAGHKPHCIYASTRGVVGSMVYTPIDEDHPTHPIDMNGIDKLAAEKYYLIYSRLYGIPVTVLRINNTYGIRCQMKHGDYGVVNWFIRMAMDEKQITINGPGHQTRDYNYVEDVAEAFVLAAQHPNAKNKLFWLGSGVQTRFIDICNMILSTTGCTMTIQHKEWDAERKAIEIGNFVVSPQRIKEALGWMPKTALNDGLRKTVEFYRKRKQEYFL